MIDVWAAFVVAIIASAFFLAAWRRHNSLPRIPVLEPLALPDCMVVIPARNEEAAIARAVGSFPRDTVIVVDDHSEDGTAEAARKAGAGVLPAPPLSRNAIGKTAACAAGASVLTCRWILFTDADTWFCERFLPSVVAYAEAYDISLLSIQLQPAYQSFAERVLVPYARALFFGGIGVSGDPNAAFSGQCVLVRREPYMFMGGHSAALTHLIEDIKLTKLAERHRLRIGIARAGNLGHARMYDGFSGMRAGIERQAFRFMVTNPVSGLSIILIAVGMCLWLPLLEWLVIGRHLIAAALFAFLPVMLLRFWYRTWVHALLTPLAIYGMIPILAAGLASAVMGKSTVWKGRVIRAVS